MLLFLQQEIPSVSPFNLLNFLVLTIYILAQGIFYLVKRKKVTHSPIHALQIDLEKVEAQVIELDNTLDKQNIQINNKLDMLLDQFDEHRGEFKEMRVQHQDLNDRMIRLEEAIKRRR